MCKYLCSLHLTTPKWSLDETSLNFPIFFFLSTFKSILKNVKHYYATLLVDGADELFDLIIEYKRRSSSFPISTINFTADYILY